MIFFSGKTATLEFEGGESLTFELEVPEDECSVCRRELGSDQRLTMDLAASTGPTFAVRICRACLGEYAPGVLEAIEA